MMKLEPCTRLLLKLVEFEGASFLTMTRILNSSGALSSFKRVNLKCSGENVSGRDHLFWCICCAQKIGHQSIFMYQTKKEKKGKESNCHCLWIVYYVQHTTSL
ncbi:hypothetical protein Droror1_Dr00027823 [Drosera rotundifolia]